MLPRIQETYRSTKRIIANVASSNVRSQTCLNSTNGPILRFRWRIQWYETTSFNSTFASEGLKDAILCKLHESRLQSHKIEKPNIIPSQFPMRQWTQGPIVHGWWWRLPKRWRHPLLTVRNLDPKWLCLYQERPDETSKTWPFCMLVWR